MSKKMLQGERELSFLAELGRASNRRTFLQWSGLTIGVVALGCSDDNSDVGTGPGGGTGVDLGTGDTGILNYAYALEQLEAAFYTEVLSKPYFSGAPAGEQAILTDIRNHEVIHRDFLKAALGAGAIPTLTVDFTSVDFADRASVLGAARTFEDLGVAAYNGAGKLLTDPANLLTAGKIVSVEARHASAIRDLLEPNSFANADVVDPRGLDLAQSPTDVLKTVDPFVTTTITSAGLPTT
jgi:Ferritin-like domain